MSEDVWLHVVFVCSVEHTVLFSAFFALRTVVDEVLLNKLLELLKQEHALSISDWKGAEWVKSWILRISSTL